MKNKMKNKVLIGMIVNKNKNIKKNKKHKHLKYRKEKVLQMRYHNNFNRLMQLSNLKLKRWNYILKTK